MRNQIDRWDQLASKDLDAAVIDPRDVSGRKNRYISGLRNQAILQSVRAEIGTDDIVLDFGCGNGSVSAQLATRGCSVIGIDISKGLLRRTADRGQLGKTLFVHYDGKSIPIRPGSIKAAVTWVVLNHIIDDSELLGLLAQIHEKLAPGGLLIAIEQVRKRPTIDLVTWQNRRTIEGFCAIFDSAGFEVANHEIVRYGRLPTTIAIRYGLIPAALYPLVARFERWVGRAAGVVAWDYCDVRFILRKRERMQE